MQEKEGNIMLYVLNMFIITCIIHASKEMRQFTLIYILGHITALFIYLFEFYMIEYHSWLSHFNNAHLFFQATPVYISVYLYTTESYKS